VRIHAHPSAEHPLYELCDTDGPREILGDQEYRALIMLMRGASPNQTRHRTGLASVESLRGRLLDEGLLIRSSCAWRHWRDDDRPRMTEGTRVRADLVKLVGSSGAWVLGYGDAMLAKACDGRRSLAQIVEVLGRKNLAPTTDKARELLRGLGALKVIESSQGHPKLASGVRFEPELLVAQPPNEEHGYVLSAAEAALLTLCDGSRSHAQLMDAGPAADAGAFLTRARAVGLLASARPEAPSVVARRSASSTGSISRRRIVAPVSSSRPAREPPPLIDPDEDIGEQKTVFEPELPAEEEAGQQSSSNDNTAPPVPAAPPPLREVPRDVTPPPLAADQALPMPAEPASSAADASQQSARLAALMSLSLDQTMDGQSFQAQPAIVERKASKLPWILLLLVAGGGTYYHLHVTGRLPEGWGPQQPITAATSPEAKGPRLETVVATDAPRTTVVAAGYVEARDPITVGVTTSGRVESVAVDAGSQVKKGQVMARLNAGELRAQLSLALAEERAATRNLTSKRKLLAAQAATQADVEAAVGQAEIARAKRLVIAQQIEQTQIRAPIDGTVLEVLARAGEVLTPSPNSTSIGVVRVADLTQLVAAIDVSEAEIHQIRVGQGVEVLTDAHGDRKYKAEVREIAQQAERTRGTIQVKVHLEKLSDGSLKPGMAVKATFVQESGKPRIVLPASAVDRGAVWVVAAGAVKRRPVVTRPNGAGSLEVTSGLEDGEQIVVEGWAGLKDGQEIR
jgi:RND family efflux transporter MFP subunit